MSDMDQLRIAFTTGLLQAGAAMAAHCRAQLEQLGVSEACAAPLLWIGRLGGGVRQVTLASYVGIEGPRWCACSTSSPPPT